jgi:integrase/recombinase XerD
MDADTVNRELSIARKAIGWWQRQGWIESDPTIGIERRPAPPDRTKALAEEQIAALAAGRLAAGEDVLEDALRVGGPRR